ncbi:tellurite resistance TerB family protein [Desulfovibrio litoralis]|uniref:Uncharacterized membrane protein YebE, DUF533 family n=1 Tax=Desulfovibrio litoralis DSM 11393 TaxID=1121455 RepID=A0A1M7T2Z9_9BACT|nr:tellurite resistance TerB family protein [Desulfovibrio litoralis]SHN65079.1 Uncharacterized membrane protein YebE, DUF533 family [Desulfovibrio litoralis DSM 11393]
MSNIFDTILNNPALKDITTKAQETIGNMSNSGASGVKDMLGGNNLGGLLGAGALGGLLGVLVSGKTAKKVAKGALVVGGTAAVGAVAWQFYQKWSQKGSDNGNVQNQTPLPVQSGVNPPVAQPASQTADVLVEAMVFAARADGHIDDEEKSRIYDTLEKLYPGQEQSAILESLLNKPLDPASIASKITNQEEAYDIYKISCLIVDVDHFMERSYLDGLASSLNISAEMKFRLEQEAESAKKSLYA